jgi:ABC-type multidrug transport system ATPase subunit
VSLVEATGLTKRFGSFTAVDGIDFTVEAATSTCPRR